MTFMTHYLPSNFSFSFLLLQQEEATGEVCLSYKLHGKSYEEKMTFSLQPKSDDK